MPVPERFDLKIIIPALEKAIHIGRVSGEKEIVKRVCWTWLPEQK
jgi:hypothetical protein